MFLEESQERGFSGVGTLLMGSLMATLLVADPPEAWRCTRPGVHCSSCGVAADHDARGALAGGANQPWDVSQTCRSASSTEARLSTPGMSMQRMKSQQLGLT